jgi:hypothetical protein
MGSLGIQPPVAIALSLLGVQGYYLALDDRHRMMDVHEIMHEELLFPEVLIRNPDDDPITILQKSFDQLWNAVGIPECGDYKDKRALTIAMNTFA